MAIIIKIHNYFLTNEFDIIEQNYPQIDYKILHLFPKRFNMFSSFSHN